MMLRSLLVSLPLALLLLGPLAVVVVSAAKKVPEEPPCRLWLAPSHLSTENAPKFGLYAGAQGFARDEVIPSHEIAVPFFDFLQSPAAHGNRAVRESIDFLESNLWVAEYAGSKYEANNSVSVFIPGVGNYAHHHSGLYNVDWLQASLILRNPDEVAQQQRGRAHPSRGAVSPYYNATLMATRAIPPGMELYCNLGSPMDDLESDVFQEKVTRWDYEHADKLLDNILAFMERFEGQMSDSFKNTILDFMVENVLEGASPKRAKVIRSLLPQRIDKLREVKAAGGTFEYRNRDIPKSPEWFEEHGLCVDNLRPGQSTIPDAGRGAFANRAIKEGATISPVQMLPILDAEVFDLYSETVAVEEEDGSISFVLDDEKEPTGQHLLLNYCYGHPESSLLLLPTAPMVNLINHAPERSQVNAYLQWSAHDHLFNDHNMHDQPLDRWRLANFPLIMMELVALRDIGKDEEILIDYGRGWDESWKAYKQAWDQAYGGGGKWPLRALDVRPLYKDKPYPVDIGEGQTPYPESVVTACFVETADDMPDGEPKLNVDELEILRWLGPTTREAFSGQHLAICDLKSREEVPGAVDGTVSYNYTAITRMNAEMVEVRYLPHSAITLVDRPYTSDMHTTNPFRHWIEMEDNRFPQAWRNLRE